MVSSAQELGIKRVRLWPKAVDTETYNPSNYSEEMRQKLSDGNPDAPLMLYVGRLSHEKRLDWLHAPISQFQGARLALVGSGPAEEHLKEKFKNTNTKFMGYMSGKELAQAYASADLFVFPSDTETLGFVAMEAMASGVPAIGARAGGIPDAINDGNTGLLFTPGDLEDLNEKVKTLLFNKELRDHYAKNARAEMEKWSWRASTEKLIDYYELARTVHKRYDPPSKY